MYQAKTFKNNQFYFQKKLVQQAGQFWLLASAWSLTNFFFSKKDENTVSVHSWSELGVRFFLLWARNFIQAYARCKQETPVVV